MGPAIIEGHNAPLPPKAHDSHVRVVVLSDTHGRHDELPILPKGDVLLHLGDVANQGSLSHIRSFVQWVHKTQDYPEIVVIEGNHDRDRRHPDRINLQEEYKDFIFLQDEYRELAGGRLKVFGATWDSCEQDDYHQLDEGGDADILLTHLNPYVRNGGHGWGGSVEITQTVKRNQVPVHLFGHVHWGRGTRVLEDENNVMVNCATAWNQPVVLDWDPVAKEATMIHCPKPGLVATAGRIFVV